jgi:hypothetical protein
MVLTFQDINYFIAIFLSVVVVAVGFVYGSGTLSNKKKLDTLQDDSKWQSALNIRNVEIADLKAQMLDQAKRYDAIIVSLQAQITALQVQIKKLMDDKEVLANTVSGRDLLEEVSAEQKKIADSLARFDILLSKDGLLNKFVENDTLMMIGIEDIKKSLSLTKRVRDPKVSISET